MPRLRKTDDETSARLPDDPSIDALDTDLRERLGRQWASRATAELRVAAIFSVVSRGLFETGADPAVIRIAARAVSDEVRHADLCRLCAERYLGRPVPWPSAGRAQMPELRGAPRELRPTLHTVAMGCVNETIASAWLEESLRPATSPLARAALRELIADDIHHARLGWAHLASPFVSKAVRRELGAWLPGLIQAVVATWVSDAKDRVVEGVPSHGVPSLETTRAVVWSTLRDVVLPGFDSLGVSTARAREWCARELEDQQGRRMAP
jgi:hypothetical protein